MSRFRVMGAVAALAAAGCGFAAVPAIAAPPVPLAAPAALPPYAALPTYADLADLADSAPLVLRARPRKIVAVEPERARGVRPGHGRFYIEARTTAMLAGAGEIGESLRYLVDLPLDARGKPPKLGKVEVLLFARLSGRAPGELQLVAPDAQIAWDAGSESRLRGILGELQAPAPPPRISGLREALYVSGTLAGEGETQMFLSTTDETAASISVLHRPGQADVWGVSFSEVLENAAGGPPRDTLAWYRLACFLPADLPPAVNLSASEAEKAQAAADYRLVRRALGDCPRTRH